MSVICKKLELKYQLITQLTFTLGNVPPLFVIFENCMPKQQCYFEEGEGRQLLVYNIYFRLVKIFVRALIHDYRSSPRLYFQTDCSEEFQKQNYISFLPTPQLPNHGFKQYQAIVKPLLQPCSLPIRCIYTTL